MSGLQYLWLEFCSPRSYQHAGRENEPRQSHRHESKAARLASGIRAKGGKLKGNPMHRMQSVMIKTYLHVLLQVLRSLEALTAKVALVRLERNMNTNMRSNVVTLDSGSSALVPLARQVEVVRALTANMFLANMLIERLGSVELFQTVVPPANEGLVGN